MKRTDLIRTIKEGARAAGRSVQEPTGSRRGPHDVYVVGGQKVPIARHAEINDYTALQIMKDLEGELGKEWWTK